MTRSDRTDPDDVHTLADRLRREAREAREANAATVPDPEHTSKIDTDPYAFDTAPTDTAPGPSETPSAENAPELVAALAQFSGRALQEAAFRAASDGRGAARYAVVAAPARSNGVVVDPNAGEVIVAPHTTQPLIAAVKPITPGFAHEVPRASFGATAKMPPRAPARAPDTTIPGVRGREARARQKRLATILIAGLALLAAVLLLVRMALKPALPVRDASVPSATPPPPPPPAEAMSAPSAPIGAAPVLPPASAAPVVAPVLAPPTIATATPRPSAPRVVTSPAPSVPAPAFSIRPPTSAPATSAPPKPAPSGKGDFVW